MAAYQLFRKDRKERQGGGVLTYVKSELSVLDKTYELASTSEAIRLPIKVPGTSTLDVLTVYRPPRKDPVADAYLLEELENIASWLDILIMGDFHAPHIDWSLTCAHSYDLAFEGFLLSTMLKLLLTQHVSFPTRVCEGQQPNCLELVLMKAQDSIEEVSCLPPLALLGDDQDRFIIDCKYYTAEVGVKAILSSEGEQETIAVAEAIVVCFEFTQLDSWEAACHWQKKASDYGTPIRLLVCSQLPEDEEARSTVYKHALQNHFEVIELNPSAVDADAGTCPFHNLTVLSSEEEFGLPRLRAALEAHQWPGLRLKAIGRLVGSQHPTGITLGTDAHNFKEVRPELSLSVTAQNAVHSPAVESQHLKEPSLGTNDAELTDFAAVSSSLNLPGPFILPLLSLPL
ncbi:unnamed protein product [Schistocephalus solidus]|uniref:Endo/exonuclease/phosphatase domain-containing protein n=1 Tax=Schistocephalus solidus TaxID=70667 RepID=A0A183SJT7_SCHSO|nr:unnamed protein product [Schistocephalus solidus]